MQVSVSGEKTHHTVYADRGSSPDVSIVIRPPLLRSQKGRATVHISVFGVGSIRVLGSAHVAGREQAELEGIAYKVRATGST